jgi:hypothetical protein
MGRPKKKPSLTPDDMAKSLAIVRNVYYDLADLQSAWEEYNAIPCRKDRQVYCARFSHDGEEKTGYLIAHSRQEASDTVFTGPCGATVKTLKSMEGADDPAAKAQQQLESIAIDINCKQKLLAMMDEQPSEDARFNEVRGRLVGLLAEQQQVYDRLKGQLETLAEAGKRRIRIPHLVGPDFELKIPERPSVFDEPAGLGGGVAPVVRTPSPGPSPERRYLNPDCGDSIIRKST